MNAFIQDDKAIPYGSCAIDIDDTLTDTYRQIAIIRLKISNPENLPLEAYLEKYPCGYNPPDYHKDQKEVIEIFRQNLNDLEWQKKLPAKENANIVLGKVHEICPILYLSARPQRVAPGTIHFLEEKRMPVAPLILRPEEVTEEEAKAWKTQKLVQLHCGGIIDDHPGLRKDLEEGKFKGFHIRFGGKAGELEELHIAHWNELLPKYGDLFKN